MFASGNTSPARECPACTGSKSQAIGEAEGFAIHRCGHCSTLFTGTLPSDDEGTDYGDYYDVRNLEIPSFVLRRLEEIVGSFDRYRAVNRWLDIGCGAGTLLEAARNRGWEPIGTEVAPDAAKMLRARGFDVRLGELSSLQLGEAAFDVVSIVEVCEHVSNPRALVAAAARVVRPGGALYITTPNGRGASARVLGTDWSIVSPPEHLQLFSASGLRRVVGDAGLTVRRMRAEGLNPHELLRRLRREDTRADGRSRVESGYRLNATLTTSRGGTVLKRVANVCLTATTLGDGLKLVAERPGGR